MIRATVTLEDDVIVTVTILDDQATNRMKTGYELVAQAFTGTSRRDVEERSAGELLKVVKRFAKGKGESLTSGREDEFAADSAIQAMKDALAQAKN